MPKGSTAALWATGARRPASLPVPALAACLLVLLYPPCAQAAAITDPASDTAAPGYADILAATANQVDAAHLQFTMTLRQPIPAGPPGYTAFIWPVDADENAATGQPFNDVGSDFNLRIYCDTNSDTDWHAVVDVIAGGVPPPVTAFEVSGATASLTIHLAAIGNPDELYFGASTISSSGGDWAPNVGHGALDVTPLPPDATKKPARVCLFPPLLVLAMDGQTTGQLTPLAWDENGDPMGLEGKIMSFWGGDANATVNAQGVVTALHAQNDCRLPYLGCAVNGVVSSNSCAVRVLHHSVPLEFLDLRGIYVWHYLLREWAGVSFEDLWSRYEVLKVTDAAYVVESELTGGVPFLGAPQMIVTDVAESDPASPCGLSGNPVRIGINLNKPFPNNNCIRKPDGQPHLGVIWHEIGHNFTGCSTQWSQLYGPDPIYPEPMATLCGMYVAANLTADPARFGLSGDTLAAVQWHHESFRSFLDDLGAYEAAGCPFAQMNPNIMDGIFLHLADLYGWDLYQTFFHLLLPYDQPWAFLDQVRNAGKVHTFTVCALSLAAGTDLRDKFRGWNFPIDDAYYEVVREQLLPRMPDRVTITSGAAGDPNPGCSGGPVALTVGARDTRDHELSYAWQDVRDSHGDIVGSFDDATKREATWTPPENDGDRPVDYQMRVVVNCSEGAAAIAGYTQRVNPRGDVNGDGQLSLDDLAAFQRAWRDFRAAEGTLDAAADLDHDGDVDCEDARALLERLGQAWAGTA